MAKYEFDFSYSMPAFGSGDTDATTREEAESNAYEYVRQTYPEADDISLITLEEVEA